MENTDIKGDGAKEAVDDEEVETLGVGGYGKVIALPSDPGIAIKTQDLYRSCTRCQRKECVSTTFRPTGVREALISRLFPLSLSVAFTGGVTSDESGKHLDLRMEVSSSSHFDSFGVLIYCTRLVYYACTAAAECVGSSVAPTSLSSLLLVSLLDFTEGGLRPGILVQEHPRG